MLSGTTHLWKEKNTSRLALALAKLSKANTSPEQGFTLLETLCAIVVISVVIASFTPPIFLAVATRFQNTRAEQALQLAQGEIDRVRRTVERGEYTESDLPPQGSAGDSSVQDQGSPGSTTTLNQNQKYSSSASEGVTVDVNGDGTPDFIVQTYRTPGVRDPEGRLAAFRMGVRVYTYSVARNFGQLENPPKKAASLTLTTALGQQRRRPLAAMYTSVVRSDTNTSLCSYQQFLGGNLPDECKN